MPLTTSQQRFLNDFLDTRARTRGRLGGRATSKIRGQYEDFCKEQQKLRGLISQLKILRGGPELAISFEQSLDVLAKQVDTAADTGDETIFKPAAKEMASIRKECQKAFDSREKEIKEVAKDIEKFDKVLTKALQEKNEEKKQQVLGVLKGKVDEWLGRHHFGHDTAQGWEIRERIVEAQGGASPEDLASAAKELESQVWELGKEIREWDDTGLDWVSINTGHGFDTQVHRLLQTIESYIDVASRAGSTFYEKQLQRTQTSCNQLRWIVDPPPAPSYPAPLPPQPVSDFTDSEDDTTVSPPPTQQETAFQKTSRLIDRFEEEYDRVKRNLRDLEQQVTTLKQDTAPFAGQLQDDYRLLDQAVEDAKRLFTAVEKPFSDIQESKEQVVKFTGESWDVLVRKIATDCESGLRQLAACEKATGQVEGGLFYIQRSCEAIEALSRRLNEIDEELLDKLLGKAPVLKACDGKATNEELELLKQLVFVSALEPGAITTLLGKIEDQKSLDKAIKKLIEEPKLSSAEMTLLLSACHQIIVDADRFFGDWSKYKSTLDTTGKAKLGKVANAAQQDIARYTIPFIPRPRRADSDSELKSVGVAIVGGGPIGLMAAVEARMSGASQVHVYEGRTDPYSRLNVLKITNPQQQRFRAAGVFDAIFPSPASASKGTASVKSIENALESRCNMMGISLERGLFLKDVRRNGNGVVELYFKGEEDTPKTCDLLIVATGASVASAQKHADNVVLSDQLGIPFQKSTVKDYAAVGVFAKDSSESTAPRERTDGWSYAFQTDEVKYIVTQLSEEEFNAYCSDPRALRERVIEDADKRNLVGRGPTPPTRTTTASSTATIDRDGLDDAIDQSWTQLLVELGGTQFYGRDVTEDERRIEKAKRRAKMSLESSLDDKKKKGDEEKVSPADIENIMLTFLNMELGVGRFPMEFQQAQQFATDDLAGVLVGDSAATPHPSTAKGLNTGVDEMGSIRDLVEDLEMRGGSEEERKKAMQAYEWEVKRRTDAMVDLAMFALQDGALNRCMEVGSKIAKLLPDNNASEIRLRLKIRNHILENMAIEKGSDKARDDRDWGKREAAIKQIRAFEKDLKQAKDDVANLLLLDDTAPLDTLLDPFNQLFP